MDSFPAHFRLLLLCARIHVTPLELDRIVSTSREVLDWKDFVQVTLAHRVASLVLATLSIAQPPSVPADVYVLLKQKAFANRRQALRSLLEMQRIQGRFAEEGLTVCLLKGAALSEEIYGDPLFRHGADLDILSDDEQIAKQIGLLEELGYVQQYPSSPLTSRRISIYSRYWKGIDLVHSGTGMALDLHWRLFNNIRHPGNALGERKELKPKTIFDREICSMSRTGQFLYCALHGVHDEWLYFKALADVAGFLRVLTPAEFEESMRCAAGLGLVHQVSSAVHLAKELLGTTMEHPLLLRADDPFHRAMRSKVLDRLVKADYRPRRCAEGSLDALGTELKIIPGLRSAREIVGRYLWRPRVWELVNLPDRWFWLCPLLGLLVPPRPSPKAEAASRAVRVP